MLKYLHDVSSCNVRTSHCWEKANQQQNEDEMLERHVRFKNEVPPGLNDALFRRLAWDFGENADSKEASSADDDTDSDSDDDV